MRERDLKNYERAFSPVCFRACRLCAATWNRLLGCSHRRCVRSANSPNDAPCRLAHWIDSLILFVGSGAGDEIRFTERMVLVAGRDSTNLPVLSANQTTAAIGFDIERLEPSDTGLATTPVVDEAA